MLPDFTLGKINKEVDSLKTKSETFAPKPTISHYYENEAAEVHKSTERMKADIASVSGANPRNNPGALSLARIGQGIDYGDVKQLPSASKTALNLGYGESAANTGAAFKKIGDEAEKAGVKVASLRGKTTELQRTILELTDDFAPRGFNRPFNAVGREIFGKYNQLSGAGETSVDSTARIAALARVRETASAVTKAESVALAAATAAEGGNAVAKTAATAASVSLTAAKQAETAATVALNAAEAESAIGFAAIKAAVIAISAPLTLLAVGAAAVYHITSDIRTEAERRLKLEEKIAFTYGDQLTKQKQSLELFKEQEYLAQRGRDLTKFESGASLDDLIKRRDNAQTRLGFFPSTTEGLSKNQQDELNPRISAIKSEISTLNAQIDASRNKNAKSISDSFNQNAESYRKSQEQARDYENGKTKERNDYAKKQQEDLTKANNSIAELNKRATDTFDNLFVKLTKDNPIASVFSEGQRELDKLKESLKGLSPELQKQAIAIQTKLNADNLFSAKLDNALNVFDLQDQAENLRNPFKNDLRKLNENPAQSFADLVDFYTKKLETDLIKSGKAGVQYHSNIFKDGKNADGTDRYFTNGFSQSQENPYTRYNSNIFEDKNGNKFTNGFSQSDARNDLLNVYERLGSGGTISRQKSFADLTEAEKKQYLGALNQVDSSKDLSLQNRLDKQLSIIDSFGANATDDQLSTINRKIISLTNGVDPRQLSERERNYAAEAREKEAVRLENKDRDEKRDREDQTRYQRNISEYIDKLKQEAKTGGTKEVDKILLEIHDAATTKSTVTRANPSDTAKQMDLSGTYFEQSRK